MERSKLSEFTTRPNPLKHQGKDTYWSEQYELGKKEEKAICSLHFSLFLSLLSFYFLANNMPQLPSEVWLEQLNSERHQFVVAAVILVFTDHSQSIQTITKITWATFRDQ